MKQRIITAVILAPLVVAGIFLLPLPSFIIALAIIALIGFWEWTQFVEQPSRLLKLIPGVAVGALSFYLLPFDSINLDTVVDSHFAMLCLGAVWWVVASILAITYPRSADLWRSSSILRHAFGILTILPFFWSVVLLRAENMTTDVYHGAKLVLFVCILVWVADSGAYFAGKSFGKHKMAPRVSPNKTIEGLIGGVIAALIAGWFAAKWFDIQFSSYAALFITTLLTVVISVLGDLVESMFKRVSGIKDSGNIIPGHGGVLDRIDSLTAAFPIFTLLYFSF
ncbi:phosphatidate cytidylyltransferase [Vibrio xiamenensis]|uniref:Phosphatidate cytidylyltransferase n=1 Tax=Vibrio xiamenensis TaxID=861298 RepID=A0A1G8EED1_9VIBR|nr:phosphatidate cytidylyltransferase [Vibrio xiamenensis]SDH68140.1 phosphatidate cytidylyltransferase [Vibrio xiamenensis]